MLEHTGWLIALPLCGALLLASAGRRMPRALCGVIGVGSVGAAAVMTAAVAAAYFGGERAGAEPYTLYLWRWIEVGPLRSDIALHIDGLSLVMAGVVTGVGAVIHLYAAEFMAKDLHYPRFLAQTNLFVAAMLVVVLAGDLLLLFLGWEGVGLCSYLLIGFWYRDPENGRAARKAFVVTRIADVALLLGTLLLLSELGTMEISALNERAAVAWASGAALPIAAASLLVVGALGKSAQLPLQVWLPDAMVGPTPVSALIHAATMVTAGVYLLVRMHPILELAPAVLNAVAMIGLLTTLIAGLSALYQDDIKRVLAYSTMSQLGTMFIGVGVGAYGAAIFHLVTHAFFKATLFLGAGVLIAARDGAHDIRSLGGLRRRLPLTFVTFVIAAAALAGVPLTAGFFSKELILAGAWARSPWLWAACIAGAGLTAAYTARLVSVLFFAPSAYAPGGSLEAAVPSFRRSFGAPVALSLLVLGAGSLGAGWLQLPDVWGGGGVFLDALSPPLAAGPAHDTALGWPLMGVALSALFAGTLAGWHPRPAAARLSPRTRDGVRAFAGPSWAPQAGTWAQMWRAGGGFDRLYQRVLVRPFLELAAALRSDPVDWLTTMVAASARDAHRLLRRSQRGLLRWHAVGLAVGCVIVVSVAVWLG